MKILSCEIERGDVRATLLCEEEDKARFGGEREAIEGCIARFSEARHAHGRQGRRRDGIRL